MGRLLLGCCADSGMGHLPLLPGLIPAAGSPLPFQEGIARVENADQENCHLSLGSMPKACKGLGVYEGRVASAVG